MGLLLCAFVATIAAATPTVAAASSVAATEAPARVVVIVGSNGGRSKDRPTLSFADDDAARLFLQLAPGAQRAWLLTTFDKESARAFPELTDIARPPTKEALAGALGEAFWALRQEKARGRATELVFAFAGHGDVDDGGQGYVVFEDGAFSRSDLAHQVLAPSPADLNHVVVDACSSYFFVKARGGKDKKSKGVPLTPDLLDALKDPMGSDFSKRTGVLVSTSQAVEVHESRALSSGVFSYLLRSALSGGGDINGDGRVEYGEAAAFVASASAGLDDPRARLSVFAEAPLQRPHSALSDLSAGTDTAFLAVDEPGRVRVLDARGQPWAEVNAAGPVYIALAGQPFFMVQRDGKGAVEEAVLVPRSGGAFALSSLDFVEAPAARSDVGPFAPLFSTPLDDGFARGFWASSGALPPAPASVRFTPAWAAGREPPPRLNVGVVGGVVVGAALLSGAGAGAAVVMNQVAFNDLEQTFRQTGQLDPAQSLAVEGWRNSATALTVSAVGLGLVGGGLLFWSLGLDDGEVVLPW